MYNNNQIQLGDIPAPNNEELERQVLFDAVTNPDVIGSMARIVTGEMFTGNSRPQIWNSLLMMFNRGENIDMVSVFSRLGKPFEQEVVMPKNETTISSGALYHAALLRDAAARRRAYFAAMRLMQSSTDNSLDEGDILAASEQATNEIRGTSPIKGETHISTIVNEVAEEVQEVARLASLGRSYRVPTSLRCLDDMMLGGWAPGQLIILAARPSVGKTAVMLQMAKTAAREGFPALVFSAELPEVEIGKRLMYSTTFINSGEVASGNMDWGRFEAASGELSHLPLFVNDSCIDINDACSRVVLAAKRGECSIAFFDYLTRFTVTADKYTTNYQKIGMITKALANTAKRAGIPVILLSQLNRESAKDNRAPELYDLRESGDIEQDADIVLMMDTRGTVQEGEIPDLNLYIRKNRQGQKEGCIILQPNNNYTTFQEMGNE